MTVKYATGGGSATPGVDYEQTTGTVGFAKGETVKSIDIVILDDNVPASGKTFNVELSEPNGATLNTPPTAAKVTIVDQLLVYLPIVLSN